MATAAQTLPPTLPDAPGKELVEVICGACHAPTVPATKHFSKAEWQAKVLEMLQEDPDVTQPERDRIVDYLAANFRPLQKINVNRATAEDLAAALDLPAKDTGAIVRYRDKNGNFKTIDDLKKVPGVDAVKLEVKKEQLEF